MWQIGLSVAWPHPPAKLYLIRQIPECWKDKNWHGDICPHWFACVCVKTKSATSNWIWLYSSLDFLNKSNKKNVTVPLQTIDLTQNENKDEISNITISIKIGRWLTVILPLSSGVSYWWYWKYCQNHTKIIWYIIYHVLPNLIPYLLIHSVKKVISH